MIFDKVAQRFSSANRVVVEGVVLYRFMFLLFVGVVATEVYFGSDPNRLDWIDWWFWARQNLTALTQAGAFTGLVMSPVQGLFGQSCPVNPFFHPLWAISAQIADPVVAHSVSSALAFVLYSLLLWVIATRFIRSKILALATVLVCVNLFFDLVPVTKIYPLPKGNFDYFEIVPPHTYSFMLALVVFFNSIVFKPGVWKVVVNLTCITLAFLADPLHPFVFFPPIVLVVGIVYLFNFRFYAKEICFTLAGVAALYFIGLIEYPLLLKDSIGRTVFNEFLFHHTKRTASATFAFQNKQNLLFALASLVILMWHVIRNRDVLSTSIFLVEVLFLLIGSIYLFSALNLDFLPNTMILESNVVPLYAIFSVRALEDIVKGLGEKLMLPLLWAIAGCLGIFVIGKAITIDVVPTGKYENFSNERLLVRDYTDGERFTGSTTFLLGTRDSDFSRANKLKGPFSMKHIMFSQNNESATEADQFLGKYGRSAALISYWLNGIPTLEENNLVTNPFYLYFFRNLFTRDDDYYMTNLNFFTVPQMHLYPMLGVRNLVSDIPTESGDQLILEDTPFFRTNFENYNFGQYAPKHPVRVDSAREAVRIMGESSFNPIEEFVIMDDTFVLPELSKGSVGRIQYQDNGIKFFGNSKGKTLHVLPVVFSNCLVAENGSRLIRVNLLLTGIIFEGQISEKISYQGPPFMNKCLKKDISDVEKFKLRDREYAYPEKADNATFNSLRDFMNWVDPIFRW